MNIVELLEEAAHRNLYHTDELSDKLTEIIQNADNELVKALVEQFKLHPRGPAFNDFIPTDIVVDLCLDIYQATVREEEEVETV